MKWLDNPKFVRIATMVIVALIAVAVITAVGLAYTVFVPQNTTRSKKTPTTTAVRRGAQSTSTPYALEFATPTRMSHKGLNRAPEDSPPTSTATPAPVVPTATPTPAPDGTGTQTIPFAHPTYQPTTQPCGDCHDNFRNAS